MAAAESVKTFGIYLPDYMGHMPENFIIYCRKNVRSRRLQQIHILGTGLVTGFIALFDTAREYTLQFTITHTGVHSHVFTAVAL
jgi:hypothetical protein